MKIAISGSAGTGKTTLAEVLSERMGVQCIPEGVREYLVSRGVVDFRNMTPADTMEMQSHLLDQKIKLENVHTDFVADRSTADNLAYCLRWCARDIQDSILSEYMVRCEQHISVYDLIVFCPWGAIPYKRDNLRSRHLYYQYEMDRLIFGILAQWTSQYYVLKSIDLEDRVLELQNVISRYRTYA